MLGIAWQMHGVLERTSWQCFSIQFAMQGAAESLRRPSHDQQRIVQKRACSCTKMFSSTAVLLKDGDKDGDAIGDWYDSGRL